MKKIILFIIIIFCGLTSLKAQSVLLAGVQNRAVDYKPWGVWGTVENMYIYLPWDYYISGKKYPVIIFFHGLGEVGNGGDDLSKVLNNGLPKVINDGHPPYSVNRQTGDTTQFVVISPQVFTDFFSAAFIGSVWNSVKHYNLSIDTNRIYVTGLSLGGEGAQNAIQAPSTVGFIPAAAVIMSPAHKITADNVSYYQNVPSWFFQGDNDGTVGQTGTDGYNLVHAAYPNTPFKLTNYSGGHCCWVDYYTPLWYDSLTTRNTPQTDNINIYDYLMRYTLGGHGDAPTANAGEDQILPSGSTSITLSGSGSFDPDGEIVAYYWSTISDATITNPNSESTTVSGLQDGNSYVFTLTVTDDSDLISTSNVTVTVSNPSLDTIPIGDRILIDLGGLDNSGLNNADGQVTTSPQPDGRYWNTANAPVNVTTDPNSSIVYDNLVDTSGNIISGAAIFMDGSDASMNLPYSSSFNTNGGNSSGVGDYPSSATIDSWIIKSNQTDMNITLLLPKGIYRIKFWGSRSTTGTLTSQLTYKGTTKSYNASGNSDFENGAVFDSIVSNGINDSLKFIISAAASSNTFAYYGVADIMKYAIDSDTTVNQPPIANAGPDQTLDAGTTQTTLDGSQSTDIDGDIVSYHWTTSSSATITNPNDAITTVAGLEDNNSYTFTLTVTDDSSATDQDNVIINVKQSEEPPGDDTATYQILLSPTTKFYKGDTVFYQMNDLLAGGLADSLIDEQLSDAPVTTFISGFSSHNGFDYPTQVVLDLGGNYKITDFKFYDRFGTDTLNILYGEPFNWSTDTLKKYENAGGWVDFPATVYTRYLKVFYSNAGYQHIKELKVYGHLNGSDSLSRIPPDNSVYHKPSTNLYQFMGVNIYGSVPVPAREGLGGTYREYLNQSYLDTSTVSQSVDEKQFVFSKFSSPTYNGTNIYYYFPEGVNSEVKTWKSFGWLEGDMEYYKNRGEVLLFSIQGTPQYFNNMGWGKPIDPNFHPDRDSTNPESYDLVSRLFWNLGAVFGGNRYPDDSLQVSYPSKDSTGLGTMEYVEMGNEINQTWNGTDNYYSPQASEAYHSAVYDGDNGRMGNRFGIKNADPNIKAIQAGMAGISYPRLKAMKYFSYYRRDDHKWPADGVNGHDYATTGINGDGIVKSPEQDSLRQHTELFVNQAHEICPRCEVWLTEFGYDRNRASPLAVPIIPGKDSAEIQAEWIVRAWLQLSFSGLDRATIFQIRNDALTKDYDSVGYTKFNTSGLLDFFGYSQPGGTVYTNYDAFPVWFYQHTLAGVLGKYKADSIIYENNDSLWVYRYNNPNNDSIAYVLWSGTETNKSVTKYLMKTGHANTSMRIIKFADNKTYGDTLNVTSDDLGQLQLTITENPIMVFTTEGQDGGQLVEREEPVLNPPTANAGSDQTIRLPINSVMLDGSAVEGDTTIDTHTWSKISGSGGTITNPSSYTSTFTGLTQGTYVLKLKVTDKNDLSDSDNVTITVNAAFIGPTANAGNDQSLDAGTTTTTLNGSATAGDGSIASYSWEVVSGDATITSPSNQNTTITGLQDGNTYTFKLTVTDSNGLTDEDEITISVAETPPPPEDNKIKFKWVKYGENAIYLIFQNQENNKYYYLKVNK